MIVRFLRFLFFILLATWLGQKLLSWLLGRSWPRQVKPDTSPAGQRLFRDPQCGTHVSRELAVTWQEAGHLHHFCSAECRERFQAEAQRAVRGVQAV